MTTRLPHSFVAAFAALFLSTLSIAAAVAPGHAPASQIAAAGSASLRG